ncbi:hypothetical protein GIB67_007621 [Kingdonia uniflora]|uniref:SSUH2-like protein n=1 Tax=Kingdonia uniflora TaxID=39325 RepID=A0A7J7N1S6_9MAGN|nr:hypothetical protein GIB67_007621 [Kingdonia uniflora]
MEEPLLSEQSSSLYQHIGRIPTASSSHGPQVSVEEIRSASALSDHYPPSIHSALITSPEPHFNDQFPVYQSGPGGSLVGNNSNEAGREFLDEVEIRELLIDHVGHRCCWGSRPARTWKISAVEDCNVYVGTLDTFIEERENIKETEPYLGGKIDGKDNGSELGIWELDLRSEFPLLFVPHKETRAKIPHSETTEKCSGDLCHVVSMIIDDVYTFKVAMAKNTGCTGRGGIPCPTCNAGDEPGFYKENQMTQCSACYGRGLIAHRDGSDTTCLKCKGEGKLPCGTCGSRGLVKCQTCQGGGAILNRNVVTVKWRTISTRKVSATKGAASVPDEVFHKAKGIQLCNTQAYQCTPAFFADSFFLNKFSSEVIADRHPVPLASRVICERHSISVVPVTRVTMAHRKQSFSFYIIGVSREVYLKDYYPSRFCWGLCPCLDWLRL